MADSKWNNCLNGTDTQNGGLQSDGETRNLYMVIIAGSVVGLICVCCAVFGFGWLCKKNKEMRETVQQIQEMYAPMEDMGDQQAVQRASVSMTQSGKQQTVLPGDDQVVL